MRQKIVLYFCDYFSDNPGQNYVDTSSRKAFLHINRTPTPPQTMLMPWFLSLLVYTTYCNTTLLRGAGGLKKER